jgi:hypothetical protein
VVVVIGLLIAIPLPMVIKMFDAAVFKDASIETESMPEIEIPELSE